MHESAANPITNSSWVSEILHPDCKAKHELPLYLERVSAGFPSPDDHLDRKLDLNELLIKHPSATFFVRVSGDSMLKACVHPDDILVVDQSLEPRDGSIVIAVVNGELTVKRLCKTGQHLLLVAENDDYPVLKIHEETDFLIWGVVTTVIHRV